MAKVVVVIPTYNERENTQEMIKALSEVFGELKNHKMELLYVDGNSPDGTSAVIEAEQKKHKWLHLLKETKKEGLGMAYAKGMRYAIDKLDADYILEFDGDFQHKPSDIPRLVEQIDAGYDYVIGSRYIKGGSIPFEWGFIRRLLSELGNLVARMVLILPKIHDVTGGFKLARVKGFVDEFDFSSLLSRSFAYKIHLLFYMVQKGAKVKEVPIEFKHRTAGESKLIKNEIAETLRVLFLLQYHNPKIQKLFKFAAVGFLGYIVNATTLFLFTKQNFPAWLAWGLSTELAIISNFTWNNLWTFKSDQIKGLTNLVKKFLQFNLTSMGALLIQVTAGLIIERILGAQYRQLILPFVILFLVLPYNYTMYNLVIWRKKK